MLLGKKLPLYALRPYDEVVRDNAPWVLIRAYWGIYVLDNTELSGTYWERRVKMLGMTLPYPLYSLKEKFTTISQIVNSKRRDFIDETGKLFKYKTSKFYTLEYDRVRTLWQTDQGTYGFTGKKCTNIFITDRDDFTHFGYIRVGSKVFLYELCTEMKKSTKRKL